MMVKLYEELPHRNKLIRSALMDRYTEKKILNEWFSDLGEGTFFLMIDNKKQYIDTRGKKRIQL
jgi:hypothetical protein